MSGDPRELIEAHVLTTCEGVTIAAGYDIPQEFEVVSRELLMWDQTGGLYPAMIIQAEEMEAEPVALGHIQHATLSVRCIVYFMPEPDEVPATTANRYRSAIEHRLMQDPSRGQQNANTRIDRSPLPLLWRDTPNGAVLEVTVHALIDYIYDAKAMPVMA